MTKEEIKQWVELLIAASEGKIIQKYDDGIWEDININNYDYLYGLPEDYRIKPQPKTRRRTYQELSNWLRECPQEHREFKRADSKYVYVVLGYDEDDANEEVSSDILIRRNNGKWEEPLIEVDE